MRAFLRSPEGCFQLKPHTTTIGRHEGSDVVLQSAGVGEHHAALQFNPRDKSFVLQDFNSPHGTFVNGCQVQNAAVRVSPGDVLRFGSGGEPFELLLEREAQPPCPPAARRTAWTGQLQVLADSKPSAPASAAHLPWLPWQHAPSSRGGQAPGAAGHVPHPPPRKPPVSSGLQSVATTPSAGTFCRTSAARPASASVVGDGVSGVGTFPGPGAPSLGTHTGDFLPQEKGAKLVQLDKEISRLSGLAAEPRQKDAVVRGLQEEVAAMAKILAQAAARNEVELTQKLLTFHRELGAKTEEIKALREQLSNLQEGSSQVFSHSLHERDLEIGRLRRESEKLKKDHALAAGLVTSLQREVVGKEQKIQQLKEDVDKMKKENREKDQQLAVVSAKCSRIKEELRCELGEREVAACRERVGELERGLEELRGELQEHQAEQERTRNQLAERAKAEEELREGCARQALQLQELGRRERLAREQLESFKARVMQVCSPAAAGKAVTEQQVIGKVRQISEENQQSHQREKHLQEELSSRLLKEKETAANLEVLEKSLQELQASLRSSCSSESLRGGLGQLEVLCLEPPVSTVRGAVLEVARVPLSWLEGVEQLLASVGMELRASGKGLLAALKRFLEDSQETTQRNQMLQSQLERAQESQAALLQEHVKELEAKQERDLQMKIKQAILEKEKENREILEIAIAKEKDKCKQSVEEEQKKIQDLEDHLRSMAEAIARKSKEQEVTDCKLQEAVDKLEEATTRELVLQQQVLTRDEQLRTMQEEAELQRQKLQEEIVEYKEQSKQHSLTIVALEDRLLEAKEQQKALEEENAALVAKVEGSRGDAQRSTSGTWLEASPPAEPHICLRLREELAVMQKVLLSKEATIAGLTKELTETRARMSDLRGELSEEQKVELEQNLSQLQHQERELNLLREKLSQLSSLVEEKDRALKAAAEELRQAQTQAHVQQQETAGKPEDAPGTPLPAGEASSREPALDLAELGARCQGLRHVETIQRQKAGLAELRGRVKMLEKSQSSAATTKGSEPLVVLPKDLPEKIVQKIGAEKEPTRVSGTQLKANRVPGHAPHWGSPGATDGAMSLERADVADLGEKMMYLEVIGALGSLLEVKELSGMQPLKLLPWEEREEVGLRRQKALELLYDKIRNLKSRLERKEKLLQDYEASVEQLRLNEASLQRCQEEMSKLEDEASREAEEKALLKEALERTQLQLSQEKRLRRAAKLHKPGPKKPFCSGKLKTKEHTAAAVKMGST